MYLHVFPCIYTVGSQVEGYRPVVLMHGLITSPESMNDLTLMIETAHPGTPIYNIDAYNDGVSVVSAVHSE